jgi:hypothetical protein
MEPHFPVFEWNETGWISCQASRKGALVRICWLPPNRRGWPFAHNGSHLVIGAKQGAVTIIDFCDVLEMLSLSKTM